MKSYYQINGLEWMKNKYNVRVNVGTNEMEIFIGETKIPYELMEDTRNFNEDLWQDAKMAVADFDMYGAAQQKVMFTDSTGQECVRFNDLNITVWESGKPFPTYPEFVAENTLAEIEKIGTYQHTISGFPIPENKKMLKYHDEMFVGMASSQL